MDWIVALAIFGTLVAIFDIYWVLRLFLCHFVAFFRKKQSIDEVILEFTICSQRRMTFCNFEWKLDLEIGIANMKLEL